MIEFDASFAIIGESMINEKRLFDYTQMSMRYAGTGLTVIIDWPWRDVSSDQRRSVAHGR